MKLFSLNQWNLKSNMVSTRQRFFICIRVIQIVYMYMSKNQSKIGISRNNSLFNMHLSDYKSRNQRSMGLEQ